MSLQSQNEVVCGNGDISREPDCIYILKPQKKQLSRQSQEPTNSSGPTVALGASNNSSQSVMDSDMYSGKNQAISGSEPVESQVCNSGYLHIS